MGEVAKAVRWLRNNLILLAVLTCWALLSWLCQSWPRGLGALLTIGFGLYVMQFSRWRKARLAALAKAELEAPQLTALAWSFLLETYRILYVRHQWRKVCASLGLVSPTLKAVPKLRYLKGTLNGDLTAGVFPGAVHADVEAFQRNAPKMAGMIRGGCKEVSIRPTGPGNAAVEFSFSHEFDKVLSLADLPESPKGTLCYGDRPDGKAAWIWSHMSAMFGGLTRKGKSVLVKTLIASAHRQRLWLNLYIADTKLGIEFARFEKEKGIQHGTVRVVAYETTPEGAAAMVKDMAEEMDRRAVVMRAANKVQWVPTREHPQLVGFFDETLPLQDSILKQGTKGAAGKVGHSGAAMCVSLWINTQIGHAAILGALRELIPQRVCFSTPTPQVTDTILGDGASNNGAACHRLGNKAGVGWSGNDESGVPQKFRSANTTAAEADRIAQGILPPEWSVKRAVRKPYHLYRGWDEAGELMYVGITNDLERRFGEHRRVDWKWCRAHRRMENFWALHVVTTTSVLVGLDVVEARARERAAIRAERPRFNHMHNGPAFARQLRGLFVKPVRLVESVPVVEGQVLVDEPAHVDGVWSE